MSLFGAIQQSNTGLQAAQIGLQVVGNNIANSSTPGYIRQRLDLSPAAVTRQGNLLLGQGVLTTGITQVVDKALAERLFAAGTAVAGGETLSRAYSQLEELVGTLEGNGITEQLTLFNNALHDLTTQPADRSLRDFVVLQGEALTRSIRTVNQQALDRQIEFDNDLGGIADEMNQHLKRIANLNVQISTVEGGGVLGSDASGLREQRYEAIEELAKFADLNIQEQPSGAISVFVGGDYLVADGNFREVYTVFSKAVDGLEIRIRETDSTLQSSGGKFGATIEARNEVFGSFLNDLDELATGLIRALNEVHSEGQGRTGFDSVIGTNRGQVGVPLRDSGLPFTPKNGAFDISVIDAKGQVASKTVIAVNALNQVTDSTLDSIAADINAIDGLAASITSEGRLQITSESTLSFTFGNDTSGFLAAAGVNTFFVGTDASDISVNEAIKDDSDYLAISKNGIGQDTEVLSSLVDLVDKPLDSLDGQSARGIFDANVAALGQRVSLQTSITEGANNYFATLQSQHLGITGVNIDEESIRLIAYNRAFQASARVISTASEMLEILMSI